MADCIIFDLDGTLIDSRADLTTGVNLVRENYGLEPLTIETVTSYVGNGARKLIERAFANTDADLEEALSMMKKFYMENMLDKTELYPGVKDGLKKLSEAGIPLAVITNKPTEPCKMILEHFGISPYIKFAIGGNSGFPLKPEPDSLLHVVKETGSAPEKSWILGDNYTDLESGRRAGIKKCLALYGFGKQREESYDLAVKSFDEFVSEILN
jgi:phosphoglycolate phosphatase